MALLILLILCALAFTSFFFITQRGMFAKEVYLYGKPNASVPDISETIEKTNSSLLMKAVKSSERIDEIPNGFDYQSTLRVLYRPDIIIDYTVYYNPYTGAGCIEKGLFLKQYYMLPSEFMNVLLQTNPLILYAGENYSYSSILNEVIYQELRNGLLYLGDKPVMSENTYEYPLLIPLQTDYTLQYNLYMDMDNRKAYAEVLSQYYLLSDKSSAVFFSSEHIYNDYKIINQSLPKIKLTAEALLTPLVSEVTWVRVKPSGEEEIEKSTVLETNVSYSPKPGTLMTVDFGTNLIPDKITLTEKRNGEVFSVTDILNDTVYIPEYEGQIDYILKAFYNNSSNPDSYGTIEQHYSFYLNLPSESRMIYSAIRPGDVLAFRVDYADDGQGFSIESNLKSFTGEYMPYGESLIIYVPVNWWTVPGDYYAKVYKTENNKKTLFKEYSISVLPDNFETTNQQLVVSPELAKKASADASAYDSKRVAAAKASSNETSFLDGLFIMPLNGAIGTTFGRTRYINGINPYRHSGLDIDGDTGDPILAGNSGVVVLAEELIRCGNTVIIDHGMKLFSSYLHMSKIGVSVGDYIEKGTLIGKVGSTGFSTGPHLHWSVTLNGNYVSPVWLIENLIVPE